MDRPFWPSAEQWTFHTWPWVLGSALFLWAVYLFGPLLTRAAGFGRLYDRLSPDAKIEWNARLLSTAHALLCSQGAIRVLWTFPDRSDPFLTTPLSEFYLSFTLGYFYLDVCLCIRHYRLFGLPFLVHGLVCFFAFIIMLHSQVLQCFACFFALWELSTVFVNARGFMVDADLKTHRCYAANQLALYVVFTLMRLVVGVPVILWCWQGLSQHPRAVGFYLTYYATSAVVMTALNTFWWYRMTLMALGTLGLIAKPKPKPTAKAADANGNGKGNSTAAAATTKPSD